MSNHSLKTFLYTASLCTLFGFSQTASAAQTPSSQATLVTIPVTVTSSVENDLASMRLSITRSGKNLASLSTEAAKAYNEAWLQLKNSQLTFKAKTTGPQTSTVWEQKKAGDKSEPVITGYRVTYRLTLTDIPATSAGKFVTAISPYFVIETCHFEASESQQEKVTNTLLKKAIEEAKNQAKLVAQTLNKDPRKVTYPTIDIHSSKHFRSNVAQMKSAMLMSAADTVPQLEAGESETSVSITVTAKIP